MNATLPAITPRRRPGRALRVLGLLGVLALVLAIAVWQGIQGLDIHQLHVFIDGDEVIVPSLLDLDLGTQLLAVLLIAAVVLGLMLFVPLVLLGVAAVVLPVVLIAVGIPIALLLGIGALLLAPLALVGGLVWWLLRTLWRENRPRPSATIPG